MAIAPKAAKAAGKTALTGLPGRTHFLDEPRADTDHPGGRPFGQQEGDGCPHHPESPVNAGHRSD
jgi:hypothetical protein